MVTATLTLDKDIGRDLEVVLVHMRNIHKKSPTDGQTIPKLFLILRTPNFYIIFVTIKTNRLRV